MLWAVTATQTTQSLSVRTPVYSIWKSDLAFTPKTVEYAAGCKCQYTHCNRRSVHPCRKVEFASGGERDNVKNDLKTKTTRGLVALKVTAITQGEGEDLEPALGSF